MYECNLETVNCTLKPLIKTLQLFKLELEVKIQNESFNFGNLPKNDKFREASIYEFEGLCLHIPLKTLVKPWFPISFINVSANNSVMVSGFNYTFEANEW